MSNDGIDLHLAELGRCFEVAENQDEASKIERVPYLAQRHKKQNLHVTRRMQLSRMVEFGVYFRLWTWSTTRGAAMTRLRRR